MKFISFGCSLVYGTELADTVDPFRWPKFSRSTWPALAAKGLGKKYLSRSQGGIGNFCILNRILDQIHVAPEDFFIISWTFMDRFDYSDPSGCHFANGYSDYATLLPSDPDSISQNYFKHLQSQHKDKLSSLIYIKTAIDGLEQAGIPFLMTCIDDSLFCQKWHAPPSVISLQNEIDPFIYRFEGRNFLQYSQHNGFAVTPSGHPLEQAHAAAADLMMPAIDAILRKA